MPRSSPDAITWTKTLPAAIWQKTPVSPGQGVYYPQMKTTRIRLLVAGGVIVASAVVCAPTALAQGIPCPTDPAAAPDNAGCASQDSMYGPVSGSPPGTDLSPISGMSPNGDMQQPAGP